MYKGLLLPLSKTSLYVEPNILSKVPTNFYISDFSSLEEFYAYIEENHYVGKNKSSHIHDESGWRGTKTFDEAISLARVKGDLKSLNKINFDDELELRKFANGLSLEGLDTSLQCSGSYVDIDAFLQGQPECMVEFVESNIPKFCDIMINVSNSCLTKGDKIRQRGITLFRLIDALERAKIRTRIIAYEITSRYYLCKDLPSSITRIVCKDYGQMLNKEQLSFVLCNPSFLRRFIFCHQEIMDNLCSLTNDKDYNTLRDVLDISGGYGSPNIISSIPEQIWKPKSNTYLFLADDVDVRSLEKLENDVKNLINKENKK